MITEKKEEYLEAIYKIGSENDKVSINNLAKNLKVADSSVIDMIKKLDNHYGHKIQYIAISASNFSSTHNQKTYSLLDYESDLKFASLNEKLLKIRDKYGVDIIKYGNEIG